MAHADFTFAVDASTKVTATGAMHKTESQVTASSSASVTTGIRRILLRMKSWINYVVP
jgi:hypothetical protein